MISVLCAAAAVFAISAPAHAQWVTNGANIYYNTGNVGVRTATPTAGVDAVSPSTPNGVGVRGVGHSASTASIGVRGITFAATGYGGLFDGGQYGVYARSVAPAGQSVGVWGQVTSPGGWGGVFKGGKYGVWGEAEGPNRYAGYFVGTVYAKGNVGIGTATPATKLTVQTTGQVFGIEHTDGTRRLTTFLDALGAWIGTFSSHPLHFFTNNFAVLSISATGNVGVRTMSPVSTFHVVGTVSASVKNFIIDHPADPQNQYLRHACIESNEYKNMYDGVATTDAQGYATVVLPAWFESLNENFRYQLTVIDGSDSDFTLAKVFSKVQGNQFVIRTSVPLTEVSWQVTGTRKDAYVLANPLIVEEQKAKADRGKYLNAEAFGVASQQGIGYALRGTPDAALATGDGRGARFPVPAEAVEPVDRLPEPVVPGPGL